MGNVCVVIPIHQKYPSALELISFQQCFKILHKRPIYVVAPQGLDISVYQKMVPSFSVRYIPPHWQSSLLGYNKLKYSRFFYRLFEAHDFLLTYELDAFVFKDDLDEWCAKGFDYIGAPWFEGLDSPESKKMVGVGNSGFSLRNAKAIRSILKEFEFRLGHEYANRFSVFLTYLKQPYRWLRNQMGENYMLQTYSKEYDDVFFSHTVPSRFPNFKVAPLKEAYKFSFEVHPRYLYELNHQQLPTGCHAWWRYDLAFWTPFIENEGYRLPKE